MRTLTLLAALLLAACSTSTSSSTTQASSPASTPSSQVAPGQVAPGQVAPGQVAPATGKVVVAKDGTHFAEPVTVDEIPAGAHYCDMGTVHYARMDAGDGTCPVCGMDLSVKQ